MMCAKQVAKKFSSQYPRNGARNKKRENEQGKNICKKRSKKQGTRKASVLEKHSDLLKKVHKKGCKELGIKHAKKVTMN